jgi:hypothetical protein
VKQRRRRKEITRRTSAKAISRGYKELRAGISKEHREEIKRGAPEKEKNKKRLTALLELINFAVLIQ